MKYRIKQRTYPNEDFIRYYPQYYSHYSTSWNVIKDSDENTHQTDFEASVYLIKAHKQKNPHIKLETIEHYVDFDDDGNMSFNTKDGELTPSSLTKEDLQWVPTDFLIKIITRSKMGIGLPTWSWDKKKYETHIPRNKPTGGGGVTADMTPDEHYTFRSACMSMIKWGIERDYLKINFETCY